MKEGWVVYRRWRREEQGRAIWMVIGKTTFQLLLPGLVFLAVIFPYLLESKHKYGRYFYNVNSTFYIWYDTWNQAIEGTKAAGDREGWPELPANQIPSFQKYVREHTPDQMWARLEDGLVGQYENAANPYGGYNYLLIYLLSLLIFASLDLRGILNLTKNYVFLLGFVTAYFWAYIILFAWFTPITEGHDARLTYSLFIPMLFTLFTAIKKITSKINPLRVGNTHIRPSHLYTIVNLTVLALLITDIYGTVPEKLARGYFGK